MSTTKRAARAVADLSKGVVLAVVEIQVPPERVFRALTTPDELVKWWGSPDTYQLTESTMDLRVGGKWRTLGRGETGPFSVSGEFLEIDPPRKLVQTWVADWDGGNTTTIHYLLDPIATGTRVTVRHEGFGDRAESCEGHSHGWERVLGWLERFVAPRAASATAAGPTYFCCRLLAPRPTFAFDMTPDERKAMLAHGAYWRELLAKGNAIVFGPVNDPKGPWGLGVIHAANEAEVHAFRDHDPAILANIGLAYEIMPMLTAVHRE
jgi:uncharacterized protein YndB with AHSA1/START domain